MGTDQLFAEDINKKSRRIKELETEIREQEKEVIAAEKGPVAVEGEEVNLARKVFKPGKLGIKAAWTTGEVEGVSPDMQAEELGVQVGWKIVKIDEEDYSEEALDAKVAEQVKYTLTFMIPIKTNDVPRDNIEESPN